MSFPNPGWMRDWHPQWRAVAGKPGIYVHDDQPGCEVEIIAYHCDAEPHHAGEEHTGCQQITMHSVHDCANHSKAPEAARQEHRRHLGCGAVLYPVAVENNDAQWPQTPAVDWPERPGEVNDALLAVDWPERPGEVQ